MKLSTQARTYFSLREKQELFCWDVSPPLALIVLCNNFKHISKKIAVPLHPQIPTKSCNDVNSPISMGRELSLLLLRFNTCKGREHSSMGKLLIWFRLERQTLQNYLLLFFCLFFFIIISHYYSPSAGKNAWLSYFHDNTTKKSSLGQRW